MTCPISGYPIFNINWEKGINRNKDNKKKNNCPGLLIKKIENYIIYWEILPCRPRKPLGKRLPIIIQVNIVENIL